MATISIRLSGDLERRLTELADVEGTGKSALARRAIEVFLDSRERERHMAALAAETRLQARATAIRMAEEGLDAANEVLAIADRRGAREQG